jgi:hypothetical protein
MPSRLITRLNRGDRNIKTARPGLSQCGNRTNFLISAAEDSSQRLQSGSPGVFRGWLKKTPSARSNWSIAKSSTRSLRCPKCWQR